jgi:hypothetical protein
MKGNRSTRWAILSCVSVVLLGASLFREIKGEAVAGETARDSAPQALLAFLPDRVDHLAQVEVKAGKGSNAGLWVAAYSYRGKQSVPHSAIIVVGPDKDTGKPKLLWKSKEEELYEPEVALAPELSYGDRPLVLVKRQKGAAWARLDVIGFRHQQPQLLDTQEAERFALLPLGSDTQPQLLAFKRKYVSALPEILEWNGEKFVPASQKFPQFYEALSRQGTEILKESDYQPLEIALLTARAGHPSEARKQLEKLWGAEKSKGAKANRGLLQAIERELNHLQAVHNP